MPRNLYRRIETAFPIEDGVLRERIISEILGTCLADNTRARTLRPDGTYRLKKPTSKEEARRSQVEFMALALGTRAHPKSSVQSDTTLKKLKVLTKPKNSR